MTLPRANAAAPAPAQNRQGTARRPPASDERQWRRMDLHIHTPASSDYQEPGVAPLEILQRAEAQGLDIIAFTDHNSVRGYAELWREIEDLELLEYLNRLQPDEAARLAEYRRLLSSMLLLPGFEFTATFGFHILAVFPERTSIRMMEHLLLLLGVPEDRLGSGEVGATTDVLRAYEVLADHGALVIGAHANSAHGVAMQGLRFGGQTKIAYTQDPHLHALEVTDLALGPQRRSTARFFSGIKAEYPRRMHCIQGSDAHRLFRDPRRETNLGIGDRATEVLLENVSFAALKALLTSEDFDRTRPHVNRSEPTRRFFAARAEGNTDAHAFHESFQTKRAGVSGILKEVVAFANSGGGTIFVGASPSEKRAIAGVTDPDEIIRLLEQEIASEISPVPPLAMEIIEADGKQILQITVSATLDTPYAYGGGTILVRQHAETAVASRDQIVAMVQQGLAARDGVNLVVEPSTAEPSQDRPRGRRKAARSPRTTLPLPTAGEPTGNGRSAAEPETTEDQRPTTPVPEAVIEASEPDRVSPGSGVEIIAAHDHDDGRSYTLRDLRHNTVVHNVTKETDRGLWRYAISQHESHPVDPERVRWHGDLGFIRGYRARGGEHRYNLAYRQDGQVRVFYGVNGGDLGETWQGVLPPRRSRKSSPSRND